MTADSGPVIGRYNESPAVCVDYDPRAAAVARLIAGLITSRLPDVTVEHVGSTAVEGCAGKGVVDLMLLYAAGELERVKSALAEMGFQRQATRDPFPEDRPMRVGAVEYEGSLFRLHVHVISAASLEAADMMSFRDRLRADPILRADYIAKKREIISKGISDSVDYSLAKEEFIKGKTI